MKAVIITEGGRNIGFGHVTRCAALCEVFRERCIDAELVVNADDTLADLLKGDSYRALNWLEEKNELFALAQASDIVMIDSYLAGENLYKEIFKLTGRRLAVIDDYNRLEYEAGIVINPSIYGPKLHYRERKGVTYLTGEKYAIVRREFRRVPEKVINKNVNNILITFGGINHGRMTRKIANHVKRKFGFNCELIEPELKKRSAKEMLSLMLKTDICISGGGQTTYELARIGVPAIGICLYENQKLNLEALRKLGIMEHAGRPDSKDMPGKITNAIRRLLPYEERIKRSKTGRLHVDGKGAERIVDTLVELTEKRLPKITLKKARDHDLKDVWVWRNHPAVRKSSSNQKPILWDEHKNWFRSKVKDSDVRIYMARAKGEKIGVIRFEKSQAAFRVSVNLNPDFLGKGLGVELIRRGTEKIFSETKNTIPVIAEIKKENITSQKAFAKAGYVCVKSTDKVFLYEKK